MLGELAHEVVHEHPRFRGNRAASDVAELDESGAPQCHSALGLLPTDRQGRIRVLMSIEAFRVRVLLFLFLSALTTHAAFAKSIGQVAKEHQQPLRSASSGLASASAVAQPSGFDARPASTHSAGQAPSAASAESPAGVVYQYDAVGNRIAADYLNGLKTRYAYDSRNRVIEVQTAKDGVVVLHQMLDRDASGLVVATLEEDAEGPLRVIDYAYDGVKRLTSESIVHRDAALSLSRMWTYDRVGNRLSETTTGADGATLRKDYVYDLNDRPVSMTVTGGSSPGTTIYSHDANGNLLSTSGPDGLIEYRYNDANRMVAMSRGQERAEFTYDADGLLVRRKVGPATGPTISQRFEWDRNRKVPQIIQEQSSTDGANFTVDATYLFADELIAQTRDGVTSYIVADAMGSTRALAANDGVVTDTFSYDAFGNLSERAGVTPIEHLYRGEQRDPNTGFYNLRARWMDPDSGRFTQVDPFPGFDTVPSSLHDYAYVANDPVNERDPSGMTNLIELNFGSMLQNLGRSTPSVSANAMNIARNAKIWDVYTYQVLWPWHSYMYTEKKTTRGGLRYDVGVPGGWGAILRAPLRTHDGIVRASPTTRSKLKGTGVRVAQFTLGQHLIWHATVVGTEQNSCPIDYNLVLGSNCTYWTAWATGKAVLLSRLKI